MLDRVQLMAIGSRFQKVLKVRADHCAQSACRQARPLRPQYHATIPACLRIRGRQWYARPNGQVRRDWHEHRAEVVSQDLVFQAGAARDLAFEAV